MRTSVLALSLAVLLVCAQATHSEAQPVARRATTIAALRSYPGFYHQQTVLVIGELRGQGERMTIGTDEASITLIARETPGEGRIEARGQFLDAGRMSPDDPRLIPFNLLDRIRTAYPERWPRPGEELMLIVGGTAPPPPTTNVTAPPLRQVAMEPNRFESQRITLLGQFRGRNLFGELPEAPAPNKWQFVLRATDAAVWVIGLQPKGKTFNFDATKRIDSGRWVTVVGVVRTGKGLTWLEGSSIELAEAPAESVAEVAIAAPPPPPVEVLFSAPAEGEADVRLDERIRMQLSRDLDPATITDRIRITYKASGTTEPGAPPSIAFTTNYARENRAFEIRPSQPWQPFRLVTVEFLEGIQGTDGGRLAPFTLTFTTGGG